MPPANPRILVDGRALLDPQGGGVFAYASNLVARLKADGVPLHVWANQARRTDMTDIDTMTRWPNKLLHAGVRFLGRPHAGELASAEADVFWSPNFHFTVPPPDMPFVLTVHDLSFERYPEFFSLKQRLWHHAVDPRALCRRADAILAVSERTKADLAALYGIEPGKIAVTYPGVSSAEILPEQLAATRKNLSLPERFILHVGALEPRKNHLSLIDAFHLLKTRPEFSDLALVLCGPRGWNNREILKAVADSPHRRDITLLGFVAPEEKAALYRLASVFAFPSYHEGFGLPPLEAMAAGTPVVASFAASLGEVVGDAGILVDPYRPAELAEALAAVLSSPSLTDRLSQKGARRAKDFTWSRCAKETLRVFTAAGCAGLRHRRSNRRISDRPEQAVTDGR